MVVNRVNTNELSRMKIEETVHDFFILQPVKLVKAYNLRNIMHDWLDDDCVKILRHLRDACDDDSMVVIDEMVTPDTGASWKQVQKDIQMIALQAAVERTESQWHALRQQVGSKIESINIYDGDLGDSVVIAVKHQFKMGG